MDEVVSLLLIAGIVLLSFGILGWIADLIMYRLGWDDEEEEKRESPDRTGDPEQGNMRKSIK